MQKEEYLIKNACYSVTKYYLCKQNNKRSLLGRKQRNQVTRSFLNRYQFSSTNKVTSLFSTSCILRIILFSEQEFILQSSHIFPAFIGYPSALDTSFSALSENHFVTPLYYIIRCKHERISPSYSMIFKFNSYLCAFFREYN